MHTFCSDFTPQALQCMISAQCEPAVPSAKLTTVMEFFKLCLQNSQNAFYISVTVQVQLKLQYTLQLNFTDFSLQSLHLRQQAC